MTPETARRLDMLSKQLGEILMTAALCAKEVSDIAHGELDPDDHTDSGGNGNGNGHGHTCCAQRPLLDESTLSVIWKGRTLHLGHTRSFWMLARLARRPNQYVTHLDLMRDVWDDELLATSSIRSLVRRLREKLQDGGMEDLAIAIRGHNGRYILDL